LVTIVTFKKFLLQMDCLIKVRRRRMESAYAAAVEAFQMAEDCRNVAKISFVASPFWTVL
jgi:hypothetical protein